MGEDDRIGLHRNGQTLYGAAKIIMKIQVGAAAWGLLRLKDEIIEDF